MKFFHRHAWKVVHVQEGEYAFPKGSPVTVVTSRCFCGKFRQEHLDGHVGRVMKEQG